MKNIIHPFGSVTLSVVSGAKIAVYSEGVAEVYLNAGYPNFPPSKSLLVSVTNGEGVTSALSTAGTVTINATSEDVYYEVGTAAVVKAIREQIYQTSPVALDATGSVTAAALLGGIVTSSTAAAVAGTVPAGTVMDAAAQFDIGDSIDWSVINTGSNAFTVTAATAHTLVGNAVVAAGKAGLFRTRKTAAGTFVTYSLANS